MCNNLPSWNLSDLYLNETSNGLLDDIGKNGMEKIE